MDGRDDGLHRETHNYLRRRQANPRAYYDLRVDEFPFSFSLSLLPFPMRPSPSVSQ